MTKKPIVYIAIRSPPCRAVLMTAAAIGLELDVQDIFRNLDKITNLNLCRTVPILDDNGVIVNDSHVIDTYLVEKYAADDSLYPKDPQKRREVDTLLYFDACHLFPRARLIVEPIFNHGAVEFEEFHIKHMQETYKLSENILGGSSYLCGEQLTIADLHAATSITSGMLYAPLHDETHPRIRAWLNRLSQLPYFDKINKEGLDVLIANIKQKIEENAKSKAQ
ncbi:glutathione S-transferase 1-like [Eurosta solidaginis]|uniref:glutathione S-transferase 1-like n=1 Tax=Eurosta solidaginis TaxID=178769 RepID=UPI003530F58B